MKEQVNSFTKSIGTIKFELMGILLLLFTTLVMAEADASQVHKLVKMTNEEDSDVIEFSLVTDDDNKEISRLVKVVYDKKGKQLSSNVYTPSQAEKGIVMERKSDRDIVILKSENFAVQNGGDIELDTLYNGINDKRKSYHYELARAGEGWELLDENKNKVSKMHFESKKVILVGTVGIKDIVTK